VPRFAHEPRTEQEVVCLFGALLQYLDDPLIIEQVQTPFPDCLARNAEGEFIKIEFELYGSHFIEHCHELNACQWIVCWIDDWGQWPKNLRVVELREVVRAKCPSIIEQISDREPGTPWNIDLFVKRCMKNGLSKHHLETIRWLVKFAKDRNLGPEWLTDAKGSFAVRDIRGQFFKVYTDGCLRFPFSRLNAGDSFSKLARDLNEALGKDLIADADMKHKGKGDDLAKLFPTADRLQKFLTVWESFANQRK